MTELQSVIADILFPPFCVSCSAPGSWWCDTCQKQVEKIQEAICPACLTIGRHACTGNLPFDHILSFGYYHDPKLRAVITALKFKGATALLTDVSAFLHRNSTRFNPDIIDPSAVIIPIPLATNRLKERGFNQAELLAECLISVYALPNMMSTDSLQREDMREVQSSLDHDSEIRRQNIANVFTCKADVPGIIILVDDVATTGATAAEAARILRENGAIKISLITLALGA